MKRPKAPPADTSLPKADSAGRRTVVGICLALTALTWCVYARTLACGFVNYDDDTYVYENSDILRGVTAAGLAHAFIRIDSANWHPLTTISHMVDSQLFGMRAGGHHFTNVLLHAVAVMLLFLLLHRLTGTVWRSAFVAAVFAIHPLRVESVAWIAERKDVLSGVFFVLTLGAYSRYAAAPRLSRYLIMSILFVCGLMSKPIFVAVPILLLLLDYWPLNRLHAVAELWPRVLEKVPLVLLSGGSIAVTLAAQKGTLQSLHNLPLTWRIENALVSCVVYLWQTLWPANLAVLYPHPENSLTPLEVGGSLVLLTAVTAAVWILRKRYPYLLVGWFWYLIMLLPVIGLVQVGVQGHADRYTYLPHIGLALLAAWAAVDISRQLRHQAQLLGAAAGTIILAMGVRAWKQTAYWRDSETLWRHTVAVTDNNDTAQNNLGSYLLKRGDVAEAMQRFEIALKLRPSDPLLRDNLAKAFTQSGRIDDAIAEYEQLVRAQPDVPEVHAGFGKALLRKGRIDEAMAQEEEALRLRPALADAHCELGNALLEKGDIDGALRQYRKMLDLQPNNPVALYNLAVAFHRGGRFAEAIGYYQKTLEIDPNHADAQRFLTQAIRDNVGRGDTRFKTVRP